MEEKDAMRHLRVAAGLMLCLLVAASVGAQDAPSQKRVLANGNLLHSLLAVPVLGQPYSATVVHETRRILTNGTTISHKGHHFVARDSEGRIRVEVRLARGNQGQPDKVMIFVVDPLAHTLTTWVKGGDANAKVATTVKIPTGSNPKPVQVPRTNPNRPQPIITTENLGMDTLQGIPVSIVRKTTIVPAGRSGNDAPITKTLETWTSPDLELVMKEQWDDPRSGERIVELDNLSRTEPDPALFRPPSGYIVKSALQTLQELEQKLSATQN